MLCKDRLAFWVLLAPSRHCGTLLSRWILLYDNKVCHTHHSQFFQLAKLDASEEQILHFFFLSHYPLTTGVAWAPVPHLELFSFFHPSSVNSSLFLLTVNRGYWSLSQVLLCEKQDYTLDRSSVRSTPFTHMRDNLESSISLIFLCLDCRRKPDSRKVPSLDSNPAPACWEVRRCQCTWLLTT